VVNKKQNECDQAAKEAAIRVPEVDAVEQGPLDVEAKKVEDIDKKESRKRIRRKSPAPREIRRSKREVL
jgi:hypothetical protein